MSRRWVAERGYRSYSAAQSAQINRIVALKELRLSLTEVPGLLDSEVWVHDKDDITNPEEQVFEIQMPQGTPNRISEPHT